MKDNSIYFEYLLKTTIFSLLKIKPEITIKYICKKSILFQIYENVFYITNTN